jgi:hypothetical protein
LKFEVLEQEAKRPAVAIRMIPAIYFFLIPLN